MTDYLNIGGVERPVRFGFSALYHYEKQTGRNAMMDFAEMQNGNASVVLMINLIFSGLCAGVRHEKGTVDFTAEDVADWIGNDVDVFQTASQMFAESFEKSEAGADEKK